MNWIYLLHLYHVSVEASNHCHHQRSLVSVSHSKTVDVRWLYWYDSALMMLASILPSTGTWWDRDNRAPRTITLPQHQRTSTSSVPSSICFLIFLSHLMLLSHAWFFVMAVNVFLSVDVFFRIMYMNDSKSLNVYEIGWLSRSYLFFLYSFIVLSL